jgi:hydroxyacylglutathione hydrolase
LEFENVKLKTIKSEGIARNSYFLSDGNETVVIDPRRDCQIYTRLAQKECAKIRYILETHRNEDYVIGSFELQNMTNAEICHSNALPFKYGDRNSPNQISGKKVTYKMRNAYSLGT